MGLFKGKLNVQQVFPYPEGMCLTIFFYPLSRYGCTCIIKLEHLCVCFFLNTCTKAEHKINAIFECENFLFSVPLFHNMAIVHVISVNIVKLYFIIIIIYL